MIVFRVTGTIFIGYGIIMDNLVYTGCVGVCVCGCMCVCVGGCMCMHACVGACVGRT